MRRGMGVIGAIGGLKLVVDQYLVAADAHAEEAVGAADGGLLGVEHFDAFDVIALEGEAGRSRRGRFGLGAWKRCRFRPWRSVGN